MVDSTHSPLARARSAHEARAWLDAASSFAAADLEAPLSIDDLERWALATGLAGNDEEMVSIYQRIYQSLHEVDPPKAAHAAFWSGFRLMAMGEPAKGSAWLARAQRLVDAASGDSVIAGYLQLPVIQQKLRARALDEAFAAAAVAITVGERYRDADLLAIARHQQGRILILQDRIREGLALLDESMLAATTGELSPVVTGLVYCGAIAGCRSIYALDRAREWTAALVTWCDSQPQLMPFSGTCLIYRAEILELGGAWTEAVSEVRRIGAYQIKNERSTVADAHYREAEIHRLRGEHDRAEAAYGSASAHGRDPQPGHALLRLQQGRTDAAMTAIRRAIDSISDPLDRVRLLPALVEIALVAGRLDEARAACVELAERAERCESAVLRAVAGEARGGVLLAEGAAADALRSFRAAFETWQEVGAPYNAARVRSAMAQACRAMGDDDGAHLEHEAARIAFERLGAPPLASPDTNVETSTETRHGLSARELEVLRLVAAGKSNKAIASQLFLSVKTIDRHLSNIFAKLNVASRSAATAFAFQNGLMGETTHDGRK